MNISSAFNLDISCSCIISTHIFLSPVSTIMVLRLLHWMCMIWIQELTLISTTLDPQLNLAYLGTPSVSLCRNLFQEVFRLMKFKGHWGQKPPAREIWPDNKLKKNVVLMSLKCQNQWWTNLWGLLKSFPKGTKISVQGTVDLWSYIMPIDRYLHAL